ncbi:MAG: hypothetical protein JW940_02700 [Polyangiaceae bacterium]|nr:hypothetical protein [Polyangiaceae bacterium]
MSLTDAIRDVCCLLAGDAPCCVCGGVIREGHRFAIPAPGRLAHPGCAEWFTVPPAKRPARLVLRAMAGEVSL